MAHLCSCSFHIPRRRSKQVGKFLVPLVAGYIILVVNIGLANLLLQGTIVGVTDPNLVIKLLH